MKQKLFDLLKGKGTYFIYLFSYLTFIILNNLLPKIYVLVVYQKFNLHFSWWAEWCRNGKYEVDWVIKEFIIFLLMKLIFVALVFWFYKRKTNSSFRKVVFEICISYLMFDVLYLLLTPICYFAGIDLNWYYGSQRYQLIINKTANFPEYIVSVFWLIILVLLAWTTEYRNLKLRYWVYRLGGVLTSLVLGCVAIMCCVVLLNYIFHRQS